MLDSKQLSWNHQRMHSKLGLSRDAVTYPLLEVFQTQHLQLLKRKDEKKIAEKCKSRKLKKKGGKKKKKKSTYIFYLNFIFIIQKLHYSRKNYLPPKC